MDFKHLASKIGFDEEDFMELVALFITTTLADLDKIKQGVCTNHPEEASAAAHSIKGAAVNLGIDEVFELAKGIELRAGRNCFDESGKAVSALKEKLSLLADMLKPKRPTNSEQMARRVSNS